jgi:hypothetical protein
MSIVQAIFDRNYDHAGKILEESFINLLERKMCEAKKRVAAKMECAMPSLPSVENAKNSLSEEDELHEGRIRVIKARMRNGKIQRRKKVSNVPGMKLIGGQLKRMTASERRARKLGAKKAARTGRGKRSQALRRRKMTLAKKSRLGI